MYQLMKKMSKKGQSTVEYVLLFAAVVAVLIVFLAPGSGVMSTSVDSSLQAGAGELDTMATRLTGSR